MSEKCEACGTEGVTNSMGYFVSNDWLRAAKLETENKKLHTELKVLKQKTEMLTDLVRRIQT